MGRVKANKVARTVKKLWTNDNVIIYFDNEDISIAIFPGNEII